MTIRQKSTVKKQTERFFFFLSAFASISCLILKFPKKFFDSLVVGRKQLFRPSVLSRIVKIPCEAETKIILLEEVIERNIHKLFLNYDIVCSYPFRIMRNADLSIEEEDAEDLLQEIEKQLKKRQWGQVIRLEVEEGIDSRLLRLIREELSIEKEDIFSINGPLDLTFLMKMYGLEGFSELKEHHYLPPQPVPELPEDADIFARIREQDILMHHPYQTFEPVVRFIRQAAKDPEVLAIKQTLYRVSGNSPIIAALEQAAENGKQVSVLVELKARFDEENNIVWAKKLEKAGLSDFIVTKKGMGYLISDED